MYPGSNLRTGIARGLSLVLLVASLVGCNLVNPFSSSPAPTSTWAPGSGPVTITTAKLTSTQAPVSGPVTITLANVSRLVEAWSDTLGGTVQFSTAPTVANGRIYIGATDYRIGSETGMLDALDAKAGTQLWSYTVGTSNSLTTPIVADGVVYIGSVNYDNDTSSLYTLDAKTGTRLWSYTAGATSNFTAPTVAKGIVYIGAENNTLVALNAKTGTTLWSYTAGATSSFTTPAVANSVVYIASEDNSGNGPGNNTLVALDAKTGTKLWSYNVGATRGFLTALAVANGVVYIASKDISENSSGNGILDALDAKTGTKLWNHAVGAPSSFTSLFTSLSAPIVANGVVYVASGNGTLDALDATSGTKVWSYDIGSGFSADSPLAVVNGVVYIDSQAYGKLSALDAKSGTRLWIYFTGGSLESQPTVTNTMVYVNSSKTLYAFALPTKAPTPAATSSASYGTTTAQHLVPSINKAPVFADIPGFHIQSTEGLQCPLSRSIIPLPADDLVFTTGRLAYSRDEIQQIRNYLHEMLYGSESITNAYTITPPPTLHWVSGSAVCTLNLEISNTGNTTVQVSSLGVQFTSTPQPNSSQQLHTLDVCSVAYQQDAGYFCQGPSGGGECGVYVVNIALQALPASSIFAETPNRGYNEAGPCPEPILHPNDTLDIVIQLTSPGTKPNTVAPYLYAVVPVLTVTDANGSHTFTLSSMAGIASFVDQQQISCYGLLHNQDTTFVPVSTFPVDTATLCLA